jgi:hypothetical protein
VHLASPFTLCNFLSQNAPVRARSADRRSSLILARRSNSQDRILVTNQAAAGAFIVAGHNARLAPLFVLLVLFLADLAPSFSFFIHLGLLPLSGLLPATFLLIALFGHQITPCFAIKNNAARRSDVPPVTLWQTAALAISGAHNMLPLYSLSQKEEGLPRFAHDSPRFKMLPADGGGEGVVG